MWTVRTYCRGRTEIKRWEDSDAAKFLKAKLNSESNKSGTSDPTLLTNTPLNHQNPQLRCQLAERRLSQITSLDELTKPGSEQLLVRLVAGEGFTTPERMGRLR